MSMIHPSPLLRFALRADAATSGTLALLQLAAAGPLAGWFGLPDPLLGATGAFLAGYAAMLVVLARARRLPSTLVALVVVGNLVWAVGCAGLAVGSLWDPTAAGVGYLLLQAVGVLAFAAVQFVGLQRSAPAGAAAAERPTMAMR